MFILLLIPTLISCQDEPKPETLSEKVSQLDSSPNLNKIVQKDETNLLRICYTNWGYMGGDDFPKKGGYPYIVTSVLERAGYIVEVDIINWTRCLDAVKKQEYDIVAALWESQDLKQNFNFLNNSIIDEILFYAHQSSGINTGDMNELKGKSVAIVRDTGGTEAFYSREDWFKVYKVTNQLQVLEMLLNKRADLAMAEPRQMNRFIQDNYPDQVDKIIPLSPAVQLNYASPAMSINHPRWLEIQEKYNAAYSELVSEGLYDELESVFKTKFEARPLNENGSTN